METAGRGSRTAHAQEEEEEAEDDDDEEEGDGWAPRPMDHANAKQGVPSTLWHTDPMIPNAQGPKPTAPSASCQVAPRMETASRGSRTAHAQEEEEEAEDDDDEEEGDGWAPRPMDHANAKQGVPSTLWHMDPMIPNAQGLKPIAPSASFQVAPRMEPTSRGSRMAHAQEEEEEAEDDDNKEEGDGWVPHPMDHANMKQMVQIPSTLWNMDPMIPNAQGLKPMAPSMNCQVAPQMEPASWGSQMAHVLEEGEDGTNGWSVPHPAQEAKERDRSEDTGDMEEGEANTPISMNSQAQTAPPAPSSTILKAAIEDLAMQAWEKTLDLVYCG